MGQPSAPVDFATVPFDPASPAPPRPRVELPPIAGVDQAAAGPDPFAPQFTEAAPSGLAVKHVVAHRRRQRRQRMLMRLVTPVMSLATLGVLVAVWLSRPPAPPQGKLEGTALSGTASLPPRLVPLDAIDLPSDTVRPILTALETRPELLVSDRMRIKFVGDPKRGLEVGVEPGVQMRFVRIDPKRDDVLADLLKREKSAWDALRLDELKPAAKEMFLAFDAARKEGADVRDLPGYRDSVGLAALTKGAGYVLQAVAGNSAFRCVGEDKDGRLYFLLPTGATSFVLTGRKLPAGSTPFKGRFTVDIDEPESAEASENETPDKSKPSPEEGEDGLAPKKSRGKKSMDETPDQQTPGESPATR